MELNLSKADKLLGSWLLGFAGNVAGQSAITPKHLFDMDRYAQCVLSDKLRLAYIATCKRSRQLQAKGINPLETLKQAVGELHFALYSVKELKT